MLIKLQKHIQENDQKCDDDLVLKDIKTGVMTAVQTLPWKEM